MIEISGMCLNFTMIFDIICRYYYFGLTLLISIIGFYLYWVMYHRPIYIFRDYYQRGFNHIADSYGKKDSKIQAINRYLRLRNNGTKLPPPFPNGWFFLFMSGDIQNGQIKNIDVLGQNLIVFRTESGVINVFDAYCPHLGANIGIGGKVRGECVECPFHLWSFRSSDGECVNVPYSTGDSVPKTAKLKKWICREVNEGIYLWHHAENAEPWDIPILEEIETNEWLYNGQSDVLVNCHIQEIPENGADVAHLNALHVRNFIEGNDIRHLQPTASYGTHVWNASWKVCDEPNMSHLAIMTMDHKISVFKNFEILPMKVSVKQYGPGIVILKFQSTFGPFAIIQTVSPLEPLLQKVIHRVYAPNTIFSNLIARITIWGETLQFERDVMVWNSKQYLDNPCLVKEDKMVKVYRKWFSQFYSENSKSFQEVKQGTLDW